MKKQTFLVGILVASALILSACAPYDEPSHQPSVTTPTTLDTPLISYNKGIISWNEIPNADKYEVSIDNQIFVTYQNKYELSVGYNSESHDAKVKAISEKPNFLKLSFETRQLSPSYFSFSISNADKRSAHLNIQSSDSEIEFYKIYINNNYIDNFATKEITLQNELFSVGENIISLYGSSNDPYLCDSISCNQKLVKNVDFDSIEICDGQLICSLGEQKIIYDTSAFPVGKSIQLIENKTILPTNYIYSSGIELAVTKLPPPELVTGTIISDDFPNSYYPFNYVANITMKLDTNLSIDKIGIKYSYQDYSSSKHLAYSTNFSINGDEVSCTFGFSSPEQCFAFSVFLVKDGFICSDSVKIR